MLDVRNIFSLSEFQRNTRQHVRRLKKTGKPEVLTVNGRAELVVQDAASYQKLLATAELVDSARIIQRRMGDDRSHDVPAARVLKRVRHALRLPPEN